MGKINPKDILLMRQALKCAEKGRGAVHPNPMVGAVLVKEGRVIAEGFHEKFGDPHAEVNAIKNSKVDPRGATLYVTLEPCSHQGKTPPCAEFVIKSGIKKVVIARQDSNPLVSGRGIAALKKAGVEVVLGVLEKESSRLNQDFDFWIRTKIPYVVVKAAQSVDGKIATSSGDSQWITGVEARKLSHQLRLEADAVLVGVNTVLKDDPKLSVRAVRTKHQPVKIILDSFLKTPPNAKIFSKESPGKVILAVTSKVSRRKIKSFEKKAQVLVVPEKAGRVDFESLLRTLGKDGIVKILVEGGGETIASALESKRVQEAYFFVAPTIIGGRSAVGSVAGNGVGRLSQALHFREWSAKPVGKDLLIHGYF